MINLIKNELIKILKKKTTYILLVITVAFIVLLNFMYKNNDDSIYSLNYSDDAIEFYEEELASYSPDDPETKEIYFDMKLKLDTVKLMQQYGFDSWQAYVINSQMDDLVDMNTINIYTTSKKHSISEKEYLEAKQSYDSFIQKLDTNDWKFFVENELNDINQQINEQIRLKNTTKDAVEIESIYSTLNNLENQKKVLEWRLQNDINYENTFLNSCLNRYVDIQDEIYQYEHTKEHEYSQTQEYYKNLDTIHEYEYYIENNIRNISSNDNRGILLNLCNEYELFFIIFAVMIAGAIVSDEFSKGTIKLLLVRPYHRAKILLSKFIVCIIMLILCITVITGLQFIIGGMIQGFSSVNIPAIVYNHHTNQVETIPVFVYVIINAFAKLPMYILLLTLAFACSTIFTNTAVSIVLPLLGYMATSLINQFAIYYNVKALQYFVTPNWDFTQYLFGGLPMFEGLQVHFSIGICLLYFFIMLATMFTVFQKRNIKNI